MNSTEASAPEARPASLAAILTVLAGFALFLVLTCWVIGGRPTTPPYGAAEGTPKDQAWQASAKGRRDYLLGLRAKQEKQAASYGWVDQKAGVVQLPVARAMELIVQDNSPQK